MKYVLLKGKLHGLTGNDLRRAAYDVASRNRITRELVHQ